MGKNKKGGKGHKKGKRQNIEKRELEFKDEDQEYAQVTKMLGNGRLEAQCFDEVIRMCHIRGTFRKRVWINVGDVILLSLREYQDDKADVIHKYTPEEARILKAYGEIPDHVVIGGTADPDGEDNNGDINFGGLSDSSNEDGGDEEDNKITTTNPDEPEENWENTLKGL